MPTFKIKNENGTWSYIGGNPTLIDSTLTKTGQAADAKIVGDKLGNLVDLSTTEKSNLVAAINEIAKNSGGSSTSSFEIPTFDLTLMGLNAIPEDGSYVSITADTSEIFTALAIGPVNIKFQFQSGSENVDASAIINPMYSETDGVYQAGITAYYGTIPTLVFFNFTNTRIMAQSKNIDIDLTNEIPIPTETDYGKVLSFTSDGFVWIEQATSGESLTDTSEVSF